MTSALGINENTQWYTPCKWLEKVREVFNGKISLDPASCSIANKRIKAKCYYHKNYSGLTHNWYDNVFLNPPYSAPDLSNFLRKAINEYEKGRINQMIILTNQGTDTKWSRIITSKAIIVFTIGRISFVRPNGHDYGGTSRGQMFSYFGNEPEKFIEVFTRNNDCWLPNALLLDTNKL